MVLDITERIVDASNVSQQDPSQVRQLVAAASYPNQQITSTHYTATHTRTACRKIRFFFFETPASLRRLQLGVCVA